MKPDLLGDDFRVWFEARLVPLHAWASTTIGQGRQLRPGIIVFRDDDTMALMPVGMESLEDKNLAAHLHRLTASLSIGRRGAILVSEAWMAAPPRDEAERLRHDREGISNHPGRWEVVFWSALRGDRQLIAHSNITRRPIRLGPFTIIDPQREMSSGRLIADEHRKGKGH